MCHHHQTSPDSPFPRRLICARHTPTGIITLIRDRLVITHGAHRKERSLQTPEEIEQALLEHFGIAPRESLNHPAG